MSRTAARRALARVRASVRGRTRRAALWARGWPGQFAPFARTATQAGTCVLANGIPKSGTYLLHRLVEWLGRWADAGVHVNPTHWDRPHPDADTDEHPALPVHALRKLRNGQFVAAHLPWSAALEREIARPSARRRIRHVLIIRDPRDALASYARFSTWSAAARETPAARAHQRSLQQDFRTDDERLAHVLRERRDFPFLAYAPWLASPACHVVRFEDLDRELRAAAHGDLGDALRGLFAYLEVDPAGVEPCALHREVYNRGLTASAQPDKIGRYRALFAPEHYALLDTPALRRALAALGYAWEAPPEDKTP